MPELPEVETTVRALRRQVIGKPIKTATAFIHQLFEKRALMTSLGHVLTGDSISSIGRRGKYLIFYMGSGKVMIAHMKMTGRFLIQKGSSSAKASKGTQETRDKYVRFHIGFVDQTSLLFSDIRKFGRIWIVPEAELDRFFSERKLGPDALSCSFEYLSENLKRNRAIKSLLLDQTCVAGVGNIYADEILWASRVHPLKKGLALSNKEIGRLIPAIYKTLKAGIKAGGASMRDYIHPDGTSGWFQTKRKVYALEGKPCARCKTLIKRIIVAQRSTHFCPKCQHD